MGCLHHCNGKPSVLFRQSAQSSFTYEYFCCILSLSLCGLGSVVEYPGPYSQQSKLMEKKYKYKYDGDRSAATDMTNNTNTDDNSLISIHQDLLKRLLRRPEAVAVGKTDPCPSYRKGRTDKSVSFVPPVTSGNDRYFQKKTRLSSSTRASNDSHSDQEEEELKETLHQLRIKKAMLISDISMEISKSTVFATTVAENLGIASHEYDHKRTLFRRIGHPKEKNLDHVASNCTQEDNKNFALLVQKISEFRMQRRLIGAHRLTGISICLISNTNSSQSACIAARFDLCSHEGHFFFPLGSLNSKTNQQPVVFLDLLCATITPNNASLQAKRLLLRLAQHTLPKTISISDVLQTCFRNTQNPDRNHYSTKRQRRRKTWQCHPLLSNVVLSSDDQGSITLDLGPFYDDGDNTAVALQGKILVTCLRVCLGAIYDAIHAYEQRVHLCQWLLQQQQHSATTTNGSLLSTTNGKRLQDVVFSNSYDRIAFSVVLHYTMDNPSNVFPVMKIHRTLKVQLTFDHDGATPDKISLGWADTLDHLDVHWILSDASSWMQFFPIPLVLKKLEEAAQQELCQN
jgi:hypothetical protein